MSEKLCLQWNDFKESLHKTIGDLRVTNEFTDVTLATEGGEQIEAHKVILASSSPIFENLFKKNRHPHPLICLRGVTLEYLSANLDFLYFGQTNVLQENQNDFLIVAEELKLMGLTEERYADVEDAKKNQEYADIQDAKNNEEYADIEDEKNNQKAKRTKIRKVNNEAVNSDPKPPLLKPPSLTSKRG